MVWKIIAIVVLAIIFIYLMGLLPSSACIYNAAIKRYVSKKPCKARKKQKEATTSRVAALWKDAINEIKQNKADLLDGPHEVITILGIRDLKLNGYLVKARPNNDKIIILSHGWHSNGLNDYGLIGTFFTETGYDLLIIDHMGQGSSEGDYIGFGVLDHLNLEKWIEYVDNLPNHYKIFVHGVSMGASTALYLNQTNLPTSVKAIIADCGYTSAWDEFRYMYKKITHVTLHLPIMALRFYIQRKAHYDIKSISSLDLLKKSRIPVLFIHGDADTFVPLWMTKKNYEVCASPKEILIVKGAPHGLSHFVAPEVYNQKVLEFIKKWEH